MDSLAGVPHRFDLLLVAARRRQGSDPVIRRDVNRPLSRYRLIHIADTGDIVFARNPIYAGADADVAATGDIKAGRIADGGIAVAYNVVSQRLRTDGHIELSGSVAEQCDIPDRRVVAGGGIVK